MQLIKFTFVSLFPNLIKFYFAESILKRAIDSGLIQVDFYNPRDFSKDKLSKVDSYQVGGGAGLLLDVYALGNTLEFVKLKYPQTRIVFLTPCAKLFNFNDSKRLSKCSHITFVCGRYEGFDERLIEIYADEVFSIGDFILTGGELSALCLCDSISRHIDGVLGNSESLHGESYENNLLEAPNFAKPYSFQNLSVPSDYSKGNHVRIRTLKLKASEAKTRYHRPDLYWHYKTKGQK